MTNLEEVKNEGACNALHSHVNARLWEAGKRLEDARKTDGKFAEEIKRARLAIDEAEAAYKELERMERP